MAQASRSSLPLHLLRYASSSLGALYRPPLSARLQLSTAASSYKEADDGIVAAAAATCESVEVDAAAAAGELQGKARKGALPGYPHEGRPRQPKEGNPMETRRAILSSPSPPGPPAEGHGGSGGYHH